MNIRMEQSLPAGDKACTHAYATKACIANQTDRLNLSIPFSSSDKNFSTLLSDLIEVFNRSEVGASHELPLLESLFYRGEEPLSFLRNFIERSGLLYEAKIAKGDDKALGDDLKGVLLRMAERPGERAEAGKTAMTLLDDIEARQLLNAKGKEDGVFYLQIPVLLPLETSSAEVCVRREGKGKGGYKGDSYRVGFSMELREAGFFSIDAIVGRDSVSVRVQAEKAEFLQFMKSHLPELSERLSGYGMTIYFKEPGCQ